MASLRYPQDVGEGTINSCVRITEYEREGIQSNFPSNTILLYMPNDLQDPIKIDWKDGEQLKMWGEFAKLGGQAVTGLANKVLGKSFNGLNRAQQVSLYRKQLVANYAVKAVEGVSNAVGNIHDITNDPLRQFQSKRVPNPGAIMLFSGVPLRRMNLSFTLYPMSQDDVETINTIVNSLKGNSLPGLELGGQAMVYPNEYEIEFLFNGEKNPFMPVLKRGVITSIEAEYTGQGFWTMTRDGSPTEIILNMEFTELEILDRSDFEFNQSTVSNFVNTFGGTITNTLNGIEDTLKTNVGGIINNIF